MSQNAFGVGQRRGKLAGLAMELVALAGLEEVGQDDGPLGVANVRFRSFRFNFSRYTCQEIVGELKVLSRYGARGSGSVHRIVRYTI